MANVQITQLPNAGPITGTEAVPIVQNGVTVQTTTGAIAASPSQTQTFLTLNQEPTLPNSRYLSTDGNLTLTDGGAQSFYRIALTGTAASLNAAGTGIMVKDTSSTVASRSIAIGTPGLGVSNANGVAGNPTISLTGLPLALSQFSGTGIVSIQNGTTLSPVAINGTANQVVVANGNASGGNPPIISMADNPVIPGLQGMVVPVGQTADRSLTPSNGTIRYSTTLGRFEGYQGGSWATFGGGDGTVTTVAGTINQINVVNSTTTPVVSLADNAVLPGSAGMVVPRGTTAQRSGPFVNGTIRYNTTTQTFEGYANGIWGGIAVGVGVTSVGTGTGLEGGPITSTGTIKISDTGVTAGSYGSTYQVPSYTVNAQGQLTAAANIAISATDIGAVTSVSGTANEITSTGGQTPVISLPSALTFTGKTVTGGTFNGVAINSASTINNSVIGGVTPAAGTFTNLTANTNVTLNPSATGTINNVTIGNLTPRAATFTSLTVNSNATIAPTTTGSMNNVIIGASTPVAGTFTNISLTSGTIINAPLSPTDIANKDYVDSVAQGLNVKAAVAWGTTANITLSGLGTQAGGEWTGTLTAGTRILVKNQTAQADNGIYAAASGAWSRTSDANTWDELVSAFVFVEDGATLADTGWVSTVNPGGTLGVTPVTFTQFSGAGTYSAGTGLTLAGNQFSITNTTVSAGSYGAANKTLTASVNAQGQLTALADTPIAISNTQVSGLGTMSTQNSNSVSISGGAINGATVGAVTPSTGAFTTLSASGNATVGGTLGVTGTSTFTGAITANGGVSGAVTSSNAVITGGSINATPIGGTTPAAGAFTTLSSSGNATVGGTLGVTGTSTFTGLITGNGGYSGDVTSSSVTVTGGTINGTAIGGTTAAAGTFTNLTVSTSANLSPTGAVTVNPGTTGTLDNVVIGGTTPRAVSMTTLTASGDGTFTGTGQIKLPAGTSLQRSGTPVNGMLRYNTDTNGFEGYSAGVWGALAGGGGAVADGCIYVNYRIISGNYTFDSTQNGESVGPITIATGATVVVSTGSRWIVF